MKAIIILSVFSIFYLIPVMAQEHQHEKQESDTAENIEHNNMNMEVNPDRSIKRQGSGTGWLPDNSPMYGYMVDSHDWNFMFHGNLFLRYNNQDVTEEGSRGDSKIDMPNWFMGMARHKIGNSGKLRLTAMISIDPLIVGGEGYPLLFQSGETWEGKPLIDRQHPHDLFSEISAEYVHSLNKKIDVIGYFGYPGEPALGPVAFMHRTSALNNPDAPLAHHWQDATHITFGTATIGLIIYDFKLEGSLFTGREPNENRYNFDKPEFDSYSLRVSANPGEHFTVQLSHAFIKSPESLTPEDNVRKTIASVIHNNNFNKKNILSTSLVWGLNNTINEHKEHSLLLESNFKLHNANIYGRAEWIQKSADELGIESLPHGEVFDISALTLGVNYSFFTFINTELISGLQGSIFKPDSELVPFYGDTPISAEVYLKVFPSLMIH